MGVIFFKGVKIKKKFLSKSYLRNYMDVDSLHQIWEKKMRI